MYVIISIVLKLPANCVPGITTSLSIYLAKKEYVVHIDFIPKSIKKKRE